MTAVPRKGAPSLGPHESVLNVGGLLNPVV